MNKIPPNYHIPENLHLSDEVLTEAAERFGTPLYVYDADMIKQQWNLLRSSFPNNIIIYYSIKANPNISIIRILRELGAYFEIASSGELAAALSAGAAASNIIFVGPGKTALEMNEAVNCGIQAIVAESSREVNDLEKISKNIGKKTCVALRINPGYGKGTIAMGGATQFGMGKDAALDILLNASRYCNLEIIGLHAYLGTGILDWKTVKNHTEIICKLSDELQRDSKKELLFIDIGGGFGIPYYEEDQPLNWNLLRPALRELIDDYLIGHPTTETIAIESGRFLVGPSGVFITSVLDLKESNGNRFVILDGGSNIFGGDNRYRGFRPTPVRVLHSDGNSDTEPITLCGPLCTSADQLAAHTHLPMPKIGDIIAFYQAGAYGLTASPGLFLSHGFPREVLFDDGKLSLIRNKLSVGDFWVKNR